MVVSSIDWAGLLIVLAVLYLIENNKTFMSLYLVLVFISILFDSIHAAELPSFDNMTPGESYGAMLWIAVFALKPLIVLTIFLHQKFEVDQEAQEGHQVRPLGLGSHHRCGRARLAAADTSLMISGSTHI